VLVGDVGLDRLSAVVFGHSRWQHQVDAEGLVADERADLGEFVSDLVREPSGRAIDAEAAGVGDGGNGGDVVGESEDRVLDAELIADGGAE